MKSDMFDHIWREKSSQKNPLWNEVKILEIEEHWRFKYRKAHMLGGGDLLIRA